MMSARSDSQSTILPLPSSPHWAPITTTLAISTTPAESLPSLLAVNFPKHRRGCPLTGAVEQNSSLSQEGARGVSLEVPLRAKRAMGALRWVSRCELAGHWPTHGLAQAVVE